MSERKWLISFPEPTWWNGPPTHWDDDREPEEEMEGEKLLERAGYEAETKTSKFKVGDVVQLKSGGPPMTVTAAQPFYVGCSYFADGNRLIESLFPSDALQLCPSPEDQGMASAP